MSHPVAVASIAAHAGVTTGSIYHHFGSKAGLYQLVRTDVEQRVVDRLEGAAATRTPADVSQLAPILLVGFDYLVTSQFLRLLGEPSPATPLGSPPSDPIEDLVSRLLGARWEPMPSLIAAAWRSALWQASEGPDAARKARTAFEHLLSPS